MNLCARFFPLFVKTVMSPLELKGFWQFATYCHIKNGQNNTFSIPPLKTYCVPVQMTGPAPRPGPNDRALDGHGPNDRAARRL